MRVTRYLLVLGVVGVAAMGGRAQDKDKLPQTPYYPLAVGTTWDYKVGSNRFQMKVVKHEKIDQALCARIELFIAQKQSSFEHIGKAGEYLARYTFEGKEAKPPVPFLPLMPKKGDRWKVESKVGDGQAIKGEFVASESDVEVPAGKYKAIKVAGQDMLVNGVKMNCVSYFAPNVGMVKQELEMAGTKIVIELEKFEAGK